MSAPDLPDTVTMHVTIYTPATALFLVPAHYDTTTRKLVSATIDGHAVPRAVLARMLQPDMFARIAELPRGTINALIAEAMAEGDAA
jgi:hypothetical protein